MLDIPDWPVLDKRSLIGGCARLPLSFDAQRLREEIAHLPTTVWGSTGGRVGVHRAADALFLRGYAPAQGEKPVEDREVLDSLPYARYLIEQLIPAKPMRCLLARLPAGTTVPAHIDRAPYFAKTVRLHFPIESHDRAWMYCENASYLMRPGEVWALNNSTVHAVWNAHESASRTHMICDFLPTPELLNLLQSAERTLGQRQPEVEQHLQLTPGGAAGA